MEHKRRIWELDALRGVCILCVVIIHLLFDLTYFLDLQIGFSPLYLFIQQYGGVIFVVLSGVCATLGSRSVRRGVLVFGCGMLITLATWGMSKLGMAAADIVVKFGVLHLLGICMMLYPLVKRLPTAAMTAVGVLAVLTGYLLADVHVDSGWLFPLGLTQTGFLSGDYFPLLPHFGWYLLGVVVGRTVYAEKVTRLPNVKQSYWAIRFFCFCGRQSLWIYLAHQPVVYVLIVLIGLLL